MKLIISQTILSCYNCVQVEGFPSFFGNSLGTVPSSSNSGGPVGERECGVIPEVGEKLGPHPQVVEETSADVTISLSVLGQELTGCYIAGQNHTVAVIWDSMDCAVCKVYILCDIHAMFLFGANQTNILKESFTNCLPLIGC